MVYIRPALRSENERLIQLMRQIPIELPDTRIIFDRQPDFFAQNCLQDFSEWLVAETEARQLVGCDGYACYATLVSEREVTVAYFFGGRIVPAFQGQGIGSQFMLDRERESRALGAELWYAHVDIGNVATWRLYGRTLSGRVQNTSRAEVLAKQPVDLPHVIYYVLFPKHDRALSRTFGHVRPISSDDIDPVIDIINSTHGGRDLFMPYTRGRFLRRVLRHNSYSLDTFYVSVTKEGDIAAVAGLWEVVHLSREIWVDKQTGAEEIKTPSVIADWGYRPGHEDDFVQLLHYICALPQIVASRGIMLCAEASPLVEHVRKAFITEEQLLFLYVRNIADATLLLRTPVYFDPVYYFM